VLWIVALSGFVLSCIKKIYKNNLIIKTGLNNAL